MEKEIKKLNKIYDEMIVIERDNKKLFVWQCPNCGNTISMPKS